MSIKRFAHFPLSLLVLAISFRFLALRILRLSAASLVSRFVSHFDAYIFLSRFLSVLFVYYDTPDLCCLSLYSLSRPPVTLLSSSLPSALQSSLVLRRHLIIIFRTVFHACRLARSADKISRDIVFGIIAIINARERQAPARPRAASACFRGSFVRAIPNLYRAFNSRRLRCNFVPVRKALSTKTPQQRAAFAGAPAARYL